MVVQVSGMSFVSDITWKSFASLDVAKKED